MFNFNEGFVLSRAKRAQIPEAASAQRAQNNEYKNASEPGLYAASQ
jgi:hypothetical protein